MGKSEDCFTRLAIVQITVVFDLNYGYQDKPTFRVIIFKTNSKLRRLHILEGLRSAEVNGNKQTTKSGNGSKIIYVPTQ